MPDYITRKRLKKKMLDRWENEGGMIPAEQMGAHESNPANDHESERPRSQASHDDSTVSPPTSPKKKRKPKQK